MSEQEWSGDFGDKYHARNRVDWRKRIKFWSQILELTGARSVWEWGCGPGWNLSAIQAGADWPVFCVGTECNPTAINQAQMAALSVDQFGLDDEDVCELVCTVGALIHVDPETVQDVMRMLVDHSSDYVLCVEYESPKPRPIKYRGRENMLWAQPFARMYEGMGLKMVMQADAGEGFDDCTATLLRKP